MPHGGGHAGGGGFHGGGYHGGFHHHHGHYYGPHYYGHRHGSPRCGLFWLIFIVVGGTIGLIVGVRVGVPSSNSSSHLYAPIDNRLITYSSAFCESLSVRFASSPGDRASSSFQLLSSEPSLSGSDSFQFQENPSFDNFLKINYQYWSFYLHKGSRIEFSVCKQELFGSSSFSYYIIKGHSRFNDWEDNPSSHKAKKSGNIYSICAGGTRTNVTFDISQNDEYYMVFYTHFHSNDILDINFNIHRTLYVAQPSQVLRKCNVSQDNACFVNLPMDFTVGLLTVHTSDPVSWSSSHEIDITCIARDWVFALIICLCVFVILAFFASLLLCCWCMIKKKKNYQPIEGQTATPTAPPRPTENPVYVSTGEAPPPYAEDPPKY